jgi:hypothetical protein
MDMEQDGDADSDWDPALDVVTKRPETEYFPLLLKLF